METIVRVPNKKVRTKAKAKPRLQRKSPKLRVAPRHKARQEKFNFSLAGLDLPFMNLGSANMSLGKQAMVGLGTRARSPMVALPKIMTVKSKSGGASNDLIVGSDLLTTITSGAANTDGDILFRADISPTNFYNTRLAQLAALYERFEFQELEFMYEPIANATQSGQVIGFHEPDPDAIYSDSDPANLKRAAAHYVEKPNQIWQETSYTVTKLDGYTDLFTNPGGVETRLGSQGTFYLMAASNLPANAPLGNIYMRYKCAFFIPQLAVTSAAATLFLENGTGQSTGVPFGTVPVLPDGYEMSNSLAYTYATSDGVATFTFTGVPTNTYLTFYSRIAISGGSGAENDYTTSGLLAVANYGTSSATVLTDYAVYLVIESKPTLSFLVNYTTLPTVTGALLTMFTTPSFVERISAKERKMRGRLEDLERKLQLLLENTNVPPQLEPPDLGETEKGDKHDRGKIPQIKMQPTSPSRNKHVMG